MVNKCIDFLKSKHENLVSLEENFVQVADENDWNVADEITIAEVKKAIEALPDKYKYVTMLYLIEGYDHGEISEIMGITEITSRTQLLRGKNQLKELLKYRYHARY